MGHSLGPLDGFFFASPLSSCSVQHSMHASTFDCMGRHDRRAVGPLDRGAGATSHPQRRLTLFFFLFFNRFFSCIHTCLVINYLYYFLEFWKKNVFLTCCGTVLHRFSFFLSARFNVTSSWHFRLSLHQSITWCQPCVIAIVSSTIIARGTITLLSPFETLKFHFFGFCQVTFRPPL